MSKKHQLVVFVLLLVALAVVPTLAQSNLGEIRVSADGVFQYLLPTDWEVAVDDNGIVVIGQDLDDPDSNHYTQIGLGIVEGSSLLEVGEQIRENYLEAGTAGYMTDAEVTSSFGKEWVAMSYDPLDHQGLYGRVKILPFDDGVFGVMNVITTYEYYASFNPIDEIEDSFMLAEGSDAATSSNPADDDAGEAQAELADMLGSSSDDEPEATEVAEADEPEEEEVEEEEPQALPSTLTDFAGDWQDAIAELQDFGVIGMGGSLVFNEPRAFYSGAVTRYTPLARNSPYADIVMAATLNFQISGESEEAEICSLFAGTQRSNPSQPLNTYIQVALGSNGLMIYVDMVDGESIDSGYIASGIDLDDPHHIMMIIQDGIMVIYLDGELVQDNIEVVDRAGAYGIALHGETSDASCEGTNIWVYQAPVVTPGVCEVTSGSAVNKRTGPGTEFSVGGQFNPGTYQEATGQAEDNAGFTWWQLEDGTWVREDVVSVQGDCASVPEVEP